MKRLLSGILAAMAIIVLAACGSDDELPVKDMEKPTISNDNDSYPQNCQVFNRGEVVPFRCTFKDNIELGSFNVEIHNNFDHHSHSTSAGDCETDPKKTPLKPWVYNSSEKIPAGRQLYKVIIDIPIPTDIDPGDYHFMVRLTDKTGWQELKAVSIKIK
ncbi:DUF4625 domain-containing protein [Prevotella sp. OH937_COT-195]|uniref:DUF4625 domain-containing protein n=1 Tax=Prevotella sp. OH937_COT-195 TaxID=2491051 RepID=UPI000F65539D|nr:DUF4625 domain-containing protein [Prevotella sp. OH937_COT-195]RRD02815.1 DUF4625 domain-containing protein [Prevotella sp. OH937_COT-195]